MAACTALFVWGGTATAQEADKGTPAPRMGGRPEGAPDFGGPGQGPREHRPPEGMAGRRAPHDFGPSPDDREDMEKQRAKLEKRHKKRGKKLKKILTDEQYTRWTEQRHPAIPEGRKDGKRHAPAGHVMKDKRQVE